jgi:protoporphyrinogen oxidase
MPFTIYEARDRVGGNCVTLRHGDFLFDSGAHRFHDRDPLVTEEIKDLLGEGLRRIDVGSQVYHEGSLIDFPLSPFSLLKALGFLTFAGAAVEILAERLRGCGNGKNGSFEALAVRRYGKTIASRFLLNYSEKLWGAPCSELSPTIAAERMKGLDLRTFVKEAILGRSAEVQHIEGSRFFYPVGGIGTIAKHLAQACGRHNIRLNSRITGLHHDNERIGEVTVNGTDRIVVDHVVSTLPVSELVRMLEPRADSDILDITRTLRFRHIVLVVLGLSRDSVTGAATVYFPDSAVPFTRVYEPRNRWRGMSPPGRTSLVAEIPCEGRDPVWNASAEALADRVAGHLENIGWIRPSDIQSFAIRRLEYAYPILDAGCQERFQRVAAYVQRFRNLRLSGRNGRFVYSWIHDMMKFGRDIVEDYAG